MSLIKSMVLVITISLSNGGKVTYELNESSYSNRIEFVDSDGINQDMLSLYQVNNLMLYEIYEVESELKYRIKERLPFADHWSVEKEFIDSYDTFLLDNGEGLQQIRKMYPNIEIGHYYVQVKELEKLYVNSNLKSILPVIDNSYILAFSDVKQGDKGLIKPIKVDVEWQDTFSRYIKICFELIKQ